jgi:hypothetical protein
MARFIPLLPPFTRGPCPKCGAESLRLRWCDASSARSVRRFTPPILVTPGANDVPYQP